MTEAILEVTLDWGRVSMRPQSVVNSSNGPVWDRLVAVVFVLFSFVVVEKKVERCKGNVKLLKSRELMSTIPKISIVRDCLIWQS